MEQSEGTGRSGASLIPPRWSKMELVHMSGSLILLWVHTHTYTHGVPGGGE